MLLAFATSPMWIAVFWMLCVFVLPSSSRSGWTWVQLPGPDAWPPGVALAPPVRPVPVGRGPLARRPGLLWAALHELARASLAVLLGPPRRAGCRGADDGSSATSPPCSPWLWTPASPRPAPSCWQAKVPATSPSARPGGRRRAGPDAGSPCPRRWPAWTTRANSAGGWRTRSSGAAGSPPRSTAGRKHSMQRRFGGGGIAASWPRPVWSC